MTTTRDHDTASQPTTELPPFVFVPDADDGAPGAHRDDTYSGDTYRGDSVATRPPTPEEAARPRRWSTGHTVAAAAVTLGVLTSGGVALAARDGGATVTVPGAPGAGQQGQLPGGPFGGRDHDNDHDRDGFGSGTPGGQLPGGTTDRTDGTDEAAATGSVTT